MRSRRLVAFVLPALVIAVAAAIVWLAPEEKTLGSGIKSIYVHVAFTWSGMFGLTLVGVLGLGALVSGNARLHRWAQIGGWVAICLFVAGLVMSTMAARVNWGGVFWSEPRMKASTQIIAVVLIVQIVNTWLHNVRIKGLLHVGAPLFMVWTMINTELVLHPRSPILTSDSASIQLTFAALFVLFIAAAGWVVWQINKRAAANP